MLEGHDDRLSADCWSRISTQNLAAETMDLDWEDVRDFENARRGLIAEMPDLVIEDAQGNALWDSRPHDAMLAGPRPDTVHPSLWRLAQLNNIRGLFEVADGVWQVRGHSLANMTVVAGQKGWIVIDPVTTVEVAEYGLRLLNDVLGRRPVTAIIYSHTHSDHWGGVAGVCGSETIPIIAPKGFTNVVLAESVVASEGLNPRNRYMYGEGLEVGPLGHVDCGLGKATEGGTVSFRAPTQEIGPEDTNLTLDGVEMQFQYAPGEAPAGLHIWLPHARVLYTADNCYASLLNVYTIRGSLSRDALVWSKSVRRALEFEDADVLIGGHHWPRWGDEATAFMEQQRDALKYLHDQSVRLMRLGYTADEVADRVVFPPELDRVWHLRGYYGSIKQNARAIVHHYLGWYDGNPAHLNPVPPKEQATETLRYMGGVEAVIARAEDDLAEGKERWVAQVLDMVLSADPGHAHARALAAKAHRRLGLTSENATWRNAYLSAAEELDGVTSLEPPIRDATGLFAEVSARTLLDFLAIRVNGPAAAGLDIPVAWDVIDRGTRVVTRLKHGVLRLDDVATEGQPAGVTVSLDHANLCNLVRGVAGPGDCHLKLSGDAAVFDQFWSIITDVTDNFPLVSHARASGPP
ncbi:MAG: alkyl sulfatase dimerization domain-containing protein [Pseudomonadota bacterium]